MLTSLFSLFYITGEFHGFLHRGWADSWKERNVFCRLFGIETIHGAGELSPTFWSELQQAVAFFLAEHEDSGRHTA